MRKFYSRRYLVAASVFLYAVVAYTAPPQGGANTAPSIALQGPQNARYIVLEQDQTGAITPVYERSVVLADPLESKSDEDIALLLAQPSREKDLLELRVTNARGTTTFAEVVAAPVWLRGEFNAGGGRIEGHQVPLSTRYVVVRIPSQSSGELTLSDAQGTSAALPITTLDTPLPLDPLVPANSLPPPPPAANRLDFLVMGDGYRSTEAAAFAADASSVLDAFFDISPYAEYENFANTATLFTPSAQSGADHPPYDADCQDFDPSCCSDTQMQFDPLEGTFVNTAFNATYCTIGIHRLLTVDTALVLAAASAYPDLHQSRRRQRRPARVRPLLHRPRRRIRHADRRLSALQRRHRPRLRAERHGPDGARPAEVAPLDQ
jgi:hypothetical protein